MANNLNNNNNMNDINNRITQLINDNAMYGRTDIFNLGNNNKSHNIQNNNTINNNNNKNNIINNNNNTNNTNNNNEININQKTNQNPSTNKLENEIESQINNIKECISIQYKYYEKLAHLVMLFYSQVLSIKKLKEQDYILQV